MKKPRRIGGFAVVTRSTWCCAGSGNQTQQDERQTKDGASRLIGSLLKPEQLPSRATSMAQQLWQRVGVGTGALLLYLMLPLHGRAVSSATDFCSRSLRSPAFDPVGGILPQMPPGAGAGVNGCVALSKSPGD